MLPTDCSVPSFLCDKPRDLRVWRRLLRKPTLLLRVSIPCSNKNEIKAGFVKLIFSLGETVNAIDTPGLVTVVAVKVSARQQPGWARQDRRQPSQGPVVLWRIRRFWAETCLALSEVAGSLLRPRLRNNVSTGTAITKIILGKQSKPFWEVLWLSQGGK